MRAADRLGIAGDRQLLLVSDPAAGQVALLASCRADEPERERRPGPGAGAAGRQLGLAGRGAPPPPTSPVADVASARVTSTRESRPASPTPGHDARPRCWRRRHPHSHRPGSHRRRLSRHSARPTQVARLAAHPRGRGHLEGTRDVTPVGQHRRLSRRAPGQRRHGRRRPGRAAPARRAGRAPRRTGPAGGAAGRGRRGCLQRASSPSSRAEPLLLVTGRRPGEQPAVAPHHGQAARRISPHARVLRSIDVWRLLQRAVRTFEVALCPQRGTEVEQGTGTARGLPSSDRAASTR